MPERPESPPLLNTWLSAQDLDNSSPAFSPLVSRDLKESSKPVSKGNITELL